jgi:hypothetical protein
MSWSCRSAGVFVMPRCRCSAKDLLHQTQQTLDTLRTHLGVGYTFIGESRVVCDSAFSDADTLVAYNKINGKHEAYFFFTTGY